MKTLFITDNGAIKFDPEKQDASTQNREYDRIRSVYLIDEPTKVVYEVGTHKEEVYADADDIILEFYSHENDYPHKIAVIKSAVFVDNIKSYKAAEQKRKEEWALKKANNEAEAEDVPCCDCAA